MIDKIKYLIELLNNANHAYYNLNKPIMTDQEYDKLYDQLLQLEKSTGIVLSYSPSQNVGYQVVSELKKVNHSIPLMSLNKTKELNELEQFIGDRECILSLKLDGLTTKIEYENNDLFRGSTRGNGKIGEDITHNLYTYKNIPLKSPEDSTVVGESIITFKDFEVVNNNLPENERYSNPRNLASGSVRQLDSSICKNRNVKFIAYGQQNSNTSTKVKQLMNLKELGFDVVPFLLVNKSNFIQAIDQLKNIAAFEGYPIDGLVCTYNDLSFGESLGVTSKYPKHSIAFKFDDAEYETPFIGLEVNTTRTGIVSLVGLFEAVDIDGVMVSKASLHNVDIFESLQLGKGDIITVRRANMVIPQIMDNLTRSNTISLPTECPSCGSKLEVRSQKEARFLHCPNENCAAKFTQKLVHFASRDALNIVGLSEATIQKFVDLGYVQSIVDLYKLNQHKKEIVNQDGFGLKSYNKLMESIEKSKETDFANFIYGLGIPNTGKTTAKLLSKIFNKDTFPFATMQGLLSIEGIGDIVANNIFEWLQNQENILVYNDLITLGFVFKNNEVKESSITAKTFVVTGSVNHFKNRKELQKKIEELGGKVASSVSKSTDYLINNDTESSSSKNVAAKKLGVAIISEDQFVEMIQ